MWARAFGPQAPAVAFYDSTTDRYSHTHPTCFGGVKGVEYLLDRFRRHAGAGVAERAAHRTIVRDRLDEQGVPLARHLSHGLERIGRGGGGGGRGRGRGGGGRRAGRPRF